MRMRKSIRISVYDSSNPLLVSIDPKTNTNSNEFLKFMIGNSEKVRHQLVINLCLTSLDKQRQRKSSST